MDDDVIRGGGSLASLLRGGTGGGDFLVPALHYNIMSKKPYDSYMSDLFRTGNRQDFSINRNGTLVVIVN